MPHTPSVTEGRASSDGTLNPGLDAAADEKETHRYGPVDDEKGGSEASGTVASPPSVDGTVTTAVPPPAAGAQDAPATPAEPEAQRTKAETTIVMLALAVSLFLAALDMTIITTAIPTISSELKSSAGYVWIGSSYLLGNAAFVPMWGKVSDIFGRKTILICAAVVFLVGSALCGASVNMGMLIAARAIQGVGAGGLISLPNIAVSDLFSQRRRAKYLGLLGAVWAIASAVGPLLGGAFTSRVSWRWCFYINLPIGGVALAVIIFVLKLHNPRTPLAQGLKAIDWIGSLLIVGGTLMLLLGLEFGGNTHPWASATVICLIIFGVITIGLFAAFEGLIARYPLMPPSLLRHRTSVAAYGLSFMHAFTFMGGSYWLPLYFQSVIAANSLLSGVYLLPFVLSLSLTSAVIGIVIKKTGNYKIPIQVGLLLMTIGFGLFIDLGSDKNWAKIIIFQIIAGCGVGCNFQPPLLSIQTNVEPREIAVATSCFGFIRQIGTSISVVVGGAIFNNRMQDQRDALVPQIGERLATLFGSENAAGSVDIVRSLPSTEKAVVQDAYWNALKYMYVLYCCTSFLGFLISFGIKQKALSSTHTEHKTGLASLKRRNEGQAPPADEEKKVGN
ncbi:multidrug resistance protein fnx1 [Purpureocillium lavendulum]|uniref:Efflux pump dotC n=1 Tax=Purpureocillium lavendulum TaxID=1247861 RepID=A0AB34FU32_9HYPO|nr:multidrug resistance protein fnx1 [Purpureocillium lavendulum]